MIDIKLHLTMTTLCTITTIFNVGMDRNSSVIFISTSYTLILSPIICRLYT